MKDDPFVVSLGYILYLAVIRFILEHGSWLIPKLSKVWFGRAFLWWSNFILFKNK